MHVVYLYPHFSYPGGAGKVVLETAKRLVKMGVKVSIIAQSGNSEILKGYPGIQFEFIGGPLPNSLSYWIRYFGIYKRVEKFLIQSVLISFFPKFSRQTTGDFYIKNTTQTFPAFGSVMIPMQWLMIFGLLMDCPPQCVFLQHFQTLS